MRQDPFLRKFSAPQEQTLSSHLAIPKLLGVSKIPGSYHSRTLVPIPGAHPRRVWPMGALPLKSPGCTHTNTVSGDIGRRRFGAVCLSAFSQIVDNSQIILKADNAGSAVAMEFCDTEPPSRFATALFLLFREQQHKFFSCPGDTFATRRWQTRVGADPFVFPSSRSPHRTVRGKLDARCCHGHPISALRSPQSHNAKHGEADPLPSKSPEINSGSAEFLSVPFAKLDSSDGVCFRFAAEAVYSWPSA